jgi:hypothetical protein
MRDNPTLGGYVVSNKYYNSVLLRLLQPYVDKIAKNNYFLSSNYLHVVEPLRDSGGERIGYYLLTIPKKKMKHFENKEEEISFFLQMSKADLYDIVSSWEKENGSYKSAYDKEFIKLLESTSLEERKEFEEEAKEILQSYSKEELIDIVLQKRYQNQKEGKIR